MPPDGSCHVQATAEKTFIPPLDKSYISMRRTKHVEELIEDDEQKPDFDDMMKKSRKRLKSMMPRMLLSVVRLNSGS